MEECFFCGDEDAEFCLDEFSEKYIGQFGCAACVDGLEGELADLF